MHSRFLQLSLVGLTLLGAASAAHAEDCRDARFDRARYIVCTFDPAEDELRLYWRGQDGRALRTFGSLSRKLEEEGRSLQFAMNGGMYEDDFSPVGLYVENGRP
ncbi:MAG: phosphodiester glycosidase family protein, partial [Alphaproteobacteria bacterium]